MAPNPAAGSHAGLPLGSLPAIVLDTETTGLQVAADRIIEIGAARIAGGRIVEGETFSELVNPGMPIPPASTAIHGIADGDVAAAKSYREVHARYAEFAGETVVIGYAIGFDLAMMKAEAGRAGLKWAAPRSLDVRHLVRLLAPQLPSESLETVGAWLGLPGRQRHRALDDAEFTARIFLALVPKLRERGIHTLAQAQRACTRLAAHMGEESAAGWLDAIPPETLAPLGTAEFARIDSFPYRHRVADLMSRPPAIVGGATTLRDILGQMMRDQISSVFVAPAEAGGAYGILTERDILRAIDRDGSGALETPADTFATTPLICVGADEFIYRAISTLAARGFRHLGVSDESGALIGALTTRDLLRQRASEAVALGESIERAESAPELGLIWSELTAVVRGLAGEGVGPHDIAAVISREVRALTRRACQLAERDMAEAGEGAPPVRYAMMVLGSAGRGESLLAMDQDNAIIFDHGLPDGPEDRWLAGLGRRVSDMLDEIGVAYCKGGVMASNAAWRRDAAGWREAIGGWISHARPDDILSSDIFFDARPVHGQRALADDLHRDAHAAAKNAPGFLKALAIRAGDFPSPFGLLGRFRLDGGRLDLKRSGLMPIFSAARVAALRTGVSARATPERLAAAAHVDAAVVASLVEAQGILLRLILTQQLRDLDRGLRLSNSVAPHELSSHERDELRWALEQVPSVRDIVGLPTFG